MSVVKATLRMKPRLRPRSRISRLATSQMLRQRGITPPPGSSAAGSGVTASMNSSDSFGGSYENVRTSPAARARASRPSRSTSRSTSSLTLSPVRSSTCSVSWPSSQSPFDPATSISRCWRPEAALSSSMAPDGDDPAASDDHDVLAYVLDQIELVAAEDDAGPGRRLLAHDVGHGRDADRVETRRTARRGRAAPGRGRAPSRAGRAAGCRATAPRAWTWRDRQDPSARATGRPPRWPPCPTCRAAGRSSSAARRPASAGRARAVRACSRTAGACRDRPAGPSSGPRRGRGPRARRRSASSSSCPRRSARGSRRCGPVGR